LELIIDFIDICLIKFENDKVNTYFPAGCDMGKGLFLTIEGGEGVGKSSFLKLLSEELRKSGKAFSMTREPGGTRIADAIRDVFSKGDELEEFTTEGEFLLVSAARAQHVRNRILPDLESGKWVLCDRFADSSRVYQGILKGLDASFLEMVIQKSTYGLVPDITFLLDCDVTISQARVAERGLLESRYDLAHIDVHETLRKGFLQVAQMFPDRVKILDASRPTDESVKEALSLMESYVHEQKSR
jgi:dTMP kinase